MDHTSSDGGSLMLEEFCKKRGDPFDQFVFLLKEPRFENLTVGKLLSDDRTRSRFFEAFVVGRLERAKLFADLLAELSEKKDSLLSENPKLSTRICHSFPPASPDSTCPGSVFVCLFVLFVFDVFFQSFSPFRVIKYCFSTTMWTSLET